MLDVLNVSSGRNTASADKFPKHVLTRGFDFGFSTGLALKDLRLCLWRPQHSAFRQRLGRAVSELLLATRKKYGADSDLHQCRARDRGACGLRISTRK
jgi:3-hydroxyisobutyrate dehydrogenase-like beta-hydroxyacid dehydrogenase